MKAIIRNIMQNIIAGTKQYSYISATIFYILLQKRITKNFE